jgi:hypothetical protein
LPSSAGCRSPIAFKSRREKPFTYGTKTKCQKPRKIASQYELFVFNRRNCGGSLLIFARWSVQRRNFVALAMRGSRYNYGTNGDEGRIGYG